MSLIPASYIEKSWHRALATLEHGELEFIAPNGEVTLARGAQPIWASRAAWVSSSRASKSALRLTKR